MSDEEKTTEIVAKGNPARETAMRIAKCIAACEGVDDSMLELLAMKDKSTGKTNLQKLVNRVDISGKQRALDPKILEQINRSD